MISRAPSIKRDNEVRNGIGLVSLVGFISTIFFANWLLKNVAQDNIPPGVVDLIPGSGVLKAPAAVFAIGLAFTFRDVLHRTMGPWVTIGAIFVGAALSYLVAPEFALPSGVAFLISELSDLSVYAPLEKRGWIGAVAASNIVGLVVDSLIFLWLAFGSLEFLGGQVVGKAVMTALALVILVPIRRAVPARA